MEKQDIIERVQQLYADAVIDLAGADCNFEMYVISPTFKGMNLLQRQKSVLALFKEELASGKLHALSVKARTPEEQSGASGLVQIAGL